MNFINFFLFWSKEKKWKGEIARLSTKFMVKLRKREKSDKDKGSINEHPALITRQKKKREASSQKTNEEMVKHKAEEEKYSNYSATSKKIRDKKKSLS